jgi:protein-tyrosine phosphatase
MINVLFVCLGNICRSPLAEGLFRKMAEEQGVAHHIVCDSAGTASYHIGELADPRTRNNASSHGVELTHRARAFHPADFDDFDLIIPMDQSNLAHIDSVRPRFTKAEIRLLRAFDPADGETDVPDPYYGDASDFETVYQIVDRGCRHLLKYIIREKLSAK